MKLTRTTEWHRINGIPWRELSLEDCSASYWRSGHQQLRPIQSAALREIATEGGALCAIGVGEGKTLISLLAARALGAKRPLLLLPAGLIKKTLREADGYARHWDIHVPEIISYEILSRAKAADFLTEFEPDCIIADEAHHLKNPKAAATRRVFRYIKARNKVGVRVPCVFLDGTLTRRSLRDYWHLASVCLPRSPLPKGWPELSEWADAIDDGVEPWARPHPGPLLDWCPEQTGDTLERARLGYQRRFVSCPGVVTTSEKTIGSSLQLDFHVLDMPSDVENAMADVEKTWERPDGFEFGDTLSLHTTLRQLALGFYYHWKERPPPVWLRARSAWATFVRQTCHRSQRYDTELQVALACKRGELSGPWYEWCAVRKTFEPETECVWINDFAAVACARWLKQNHPCLVWTEHQAFGRMVAQLAGKLADFHGEAGIGINTGDPIESRIGHSAVLSVQANREGRNLQAWSRNLIASVPSAGDHLEQLLGRTHRQGQKAATVRATFLITHDLHIDSFEKARTGARYLESTLGQKQKLLFADIISPDQEQE